MLLVLTISIAGCIENQDNAEASNIINNERGSEEEPVILGDLNAPVHIVEYSDLECYYCRSFHLNTFDQIKEEYVNTGKISFEYKHYPLPSHSYSQKSAEAVECATDQGKRWSMIDKIFTSNSLSVSSLKNHANELELDTEEFNECLDSGKYYQKVQSDLQEGQSLGITGTPTFFINGIKVSGAQPFNKFKEIIDSELKE